MWYVYLIIIIVSLGAGIGIEVGLLKLSNFLYYRKLFSGSMPNTLFSIYDKQSEMLKGQDVDTVFLGDSITQAYNIGDYFLGKKYVNRGIGGDITKGVISRLQSQVIDLNPRQIIILIGTNDLSDNLQPKNILENYEIILNKISEKLPNCKVFIESIYPLNEKMHTHKVRTNNRIIATNQLIKELCEKRNITYIDLWGVLSDSNGQLIKKYTYDGLHLLPEGYVEVTKVLKSNIDGL